MGYSDVGCINYVGLNEIREFREFRELKFDSYGPFLYDNQSLILFEFSSFDYIFRTPLSHLCQWHRLPPMVMSSMFLFIRRNIPPRPNRTPSLLYLRNDPTDIEKFLHFRTFKNSLKNSQILQTVIRTGSRAERQPYDLSGVQTD